MTRLDRTEATFETSSARLPGGVVLPSTLNDALASDNLAVFVGAGASVEPPAAPLPRVLAPHCPRSWFLTALRF